VSYLFSRGFWWLKPAISWEFIYHVFTSLKIILENGGKWEQLTQMKQHFCSFWSAPCEFSVCEKSKLTSLGPDFLQTELLYSEQGEFPHPALLAHLSHGSKIPTPGVKWYFALHGWAETEVFIQCQMWDSLRGNTGAVWAKLKLLNSSETTVLLL